MRVTALIENTALSPEFVCEHGLSLLLETADGVILFDAGKSDSFLLNAKRLGIDLQKVDLAILSHGHNDHSGGMEAFLKLNTHAPLYLRETALDTHLSLKAGGVASISVDISPELLKTERIHFTSGKERIGENLLLFTSSIGKGSTADSNQTLYILRNDRVVADPFLHEQNLILTEGNKKTLITGCAHRGIVNILARAVELAGQPMDTVIGGFHLSSPSLGTTEPDWVLRKIASALLEYPETQYYTCHCTGLKAFEKLKELMPGRLSYLHSGEQILV